MLVFALIVSALMGLYQEKLYATHGKYPEEALFYSVSSLPSIYSFISSDGLASPTSPLIRTCRKGYLPSCSSLQSIK